MFPACLGFRGGALAVVVEEELLDLVVESHALTEWVEVFDVSAVADCRAWSREVVCLDEALVVVCGYVGEVVRPVAGGHSGEAWVAYGVRLGRLVF